MSEAAAVLAFAVDLFSDIGQVQARRMFGGAGLYAGGVMFGLIDDDVIFLKVDEALRADLAAAGARSWIYTERKGPKAGIPQETSYWSLPESALDDPEEACASPLARRRPGDQGRQAGSGPDLAYLVEEAPKSWIVAQRDVEAHPGRWLQIGPKDIANAQDHALIARALRQTFGVVDSGKPRPEEVGAAGLHEHLHARAAQ